MRQVRFLGLLIAAIIGCTPSPAGTDAGKQTQSTASPTATASPAPTAQASNTSGILKELTPGPKEVMVGKEARIARFMLDKAHLAWKGRPGLDGALWKLRVRPDDGRDSGFTVLVKERTPTLEIYATFREIGEHEVLFEAEDASGVIGEAKVTLTVKVEPTAAPTAPTTAPTAAPTTAPTAAPTTAPSQGPVMTPAPTAPPSPLGISTSIARVGAGTGIVVAGLVAPALRTAPGSSVTPEQAHAKALTGTAGFALLRLLPNGQVENSTATGSVGVTGGGFTLSAAPGLPNGQYLVCSIAAGLPEACLNQQASGSANVSKNPDRDPGQLLILQVTGGIVDVN